MIALLSLACVQPPSTPVAPGTPLDPLTEPFAPLPGFEEVQGLTETVLPSVCGDVDLHRVDTFADGETLEDKLQFIRRALEDVVDANGIRSRIIVVDSPEDAPQLLDFPEAPPDGPPICAMERLFAQVRVESDDGRYAGTGILVATHNLETELFGWSVPAEDWDGAPLPTDPRESDGEVLMFGSSNGGIGWVEQWVEDGPFIPIAAYP